MSYILDALKKSEQERGKGNIPNVQTIHSSSINYSEEKNTYWPYILIAAVLLNLLAISYFIFDKEENLRTEDSYTATQKNIDTIKAQTQADEELKKTDRQALNEISNKPITVNTENKPGSSTSSSRQASNTSKPSSSLEKLTREKKAIPKKSASDADSRAITDYYDLSESMQQKLPSITVSAHVYSTNPLQRSIVINTNFMEEGEYISNKLFLHEITRDGAIFDYQGELINYSVVSKWQ